LKIREIGRSLFFPVDFTGVTFGDNDGWHPGGFFFMLAKRTNHPDAALRAAAYLLKPLDLKLLVQKVERVCEYRKCINPEAVMGAFLNLNREIIEAASGGAADLTVWLAQVQDRLNHLFQVFRAVEHALLEHRQRLAEIAAYVEQAREDIPADHPLNEMLLRIAEKAAQRL
jgi:hypothetical protein